MLLRRKKNYSNFSNTFISYGKRIFFYFSEILLHFRDPNKIMKKNPRHI